MYLTDILILNSGPLPDFEFKAAFNADGTPKPILLVGPNGSGKTVLMSVVADALVEMAAKKFRNVTPTNGISRQFFRVLGGRSISVNATYEIAAARFKDGTDDFYYCSKAGQVQPTDIASRLSNFLPVSNWQTDQNDKIIVGYPNNVSDRISDIFGNGAYVFFPVTRFELPYWANLDALENDPNILFVPNFTGHLHNKIVVQTTFDETKSWILGLLVDSSISAPEVLGLPTLELVRAKSLEKLNSAARPLNGLQAILSAILQRPAYFSRLIRAQGERRICIAWDGKVILPTLDNLSSGQTSLLSIFSTILRYADYGPAPKDPDAIEGIVLVDEIDAHLHADLQHDVLPSLLKMFPRVQFIVTSHSPLFPLGMQKIFGDNGFSLIEMPSGTTIAAERFSEFGASLSYLQATKTFEQHVHDRLAQSHRPLILCEGETDPKYLKVAAELLGFSDLSDMADFEWVGTKTPSKQSEGGGEKNLDNALRFLRDNPRFVTRKVVLLYDCDTKKVNTDEENLFVRCLSKNPDNQATDNGIENLLPDEVFEERFYSEKITKHGAKRVIVKELRKTDLCTYLCESVRNPEHFKKFSDILLELQGILIPTEKVGAETVPSPDAPPHDPPDA